MPVVFITGGHSGIGFECCRHIASIYRLDLILAGRNPERIEPIAQELRSTYQIKVTVIQLDTSSLASVRSAAAQCRELIERGDIESIQAISCNAGARLLEYSYSVDGYEMTFASNFLGHFLLVELLYPFLAERGRIVLTASGTHDPDTMDGKLVGSAASPDAATLANVGKYGNKPLSTGQLYATSKLCMMLHAYELHRRLARSGSSVSSIAFDPGMTSNTGFLNGLPRPVQWISNSNILNPVFKWLGVAIGDVAFSGASLARLLADREFDSSSGKYFQCSSGRLAERRSSKMSYDAELALKLWNDSKALVHLEQTEEPFQLR